MNKHDVSLYALILSLAASACGTVNHGSSAPSESNLELCKRSFAASCNATFTCDDPATLAANVDTIGATEAECTALLSKDCSSNGLCVDGVPYNSTAARQCADAMATLSCDDVLNNVLPEACSNVCKSAVTMGAAGASASP